MQRKKQLCQSDSKNKFADTRKYKANNLPWQKMFCFGRDNWLESDKTAVAREVEGGRVEGVGVYIV